LGRRHGADSFFPDRFSLALRGELSVLLPEQVAERAEAAHTGDTDYVDN
jgi:hypothetical protein